MCRFEDSCLTIFSYFVKPVSILLWEWFQQFFQVLFLLCSRIFNRDFCFLAMPIILAVFGVFPWDIGSCREERPEKEVNFFKVVFWLVLILLHFYFVQFACLVTDLHCRKPMFHCVTLQTVSLLIVCCFSFWRHTWHSNMLSFTSVIFYASSLSSAIDCLCPLHVTNDWFC